MVLLAIIGIAIHVLSLIGACQFFRAPGASREADKIIIATLAFASVSSLIGQGIIWYWTSRFHETASISDKVWGAVFVFNGFLYYTLTRLYAQHRADRCPFDENHPR